MVLHPGCNTVPLFIEPGQVSHVPKAPVQAQEDPPRIGVGDIVRPQLLPARLQLGDLLLYALPPSNGGETVIAILANVRWSRSTRRLCRHTCRQSRGLALAQGLCHGRQTRKMAPDQGKLELAPDRLVRAPGFEPGTHGLKVRTRPAVEGVPLLSRLHVASVLPVLSPFPNTSVAGHLSAVVRPARPSRGGCRHGCRLMAPRQSDDHPTTDAR